MIESCMAYMIMSVFKPIAVPFSYLRKQIGRENSPFHFMRVLIVRSVSRNLWREEPVEMP